MPLNPINQPTNKTLDYVMGWVVRLSFRFVLDKEINKKMTRSSRNVNGRYFYNPTAQVECDTRLILKRSLTGLNSEFSF